MQDKSNTKNGWLIIAVIAVFIWYLTFARKADSVTISSSKDEIAQYSLYENVVDPSDSRPLQNVIGKKSTFKSTTYDLEVNNTIIQTNKEVTYHTFDFEMMTVIEKTKLNGQWITLQYPMNAFYTEKGSLGTTYVIAVKMLGVKEIWFCPDVPNLGYDYDDGSRLAFYNLVKM